MKIVDRLMTVKEVADYLQKDTAWVSNQCKTKQIVAFKLGKSWKISQADLQEFLNERRNIA
jgi:excisionase family DNA binding protein